MLAQTDAVWELLLVDDGSTDASAATADQLAAEDPGRIRVLRHPSGENRGLPRSRNLGLSEAESSLVAFIDADDRWEPFKLAEQAALFRRDPELTMVCGPTLYRPIGEGEPSTLTPVLVDAPRRLGTGEFAAEMVRQRHAAASVERDVPHGRCCGKPAACQQATASMRISARSSPSA